MTSYTKEQRIDIIRILFWGLDPQSEITMEEILRRTGFSQTAAFLAVTGMRASNELARRREGNTFYYLRGKDLKRPKPSSKVA